MIKINAAFPVASPLAIEPASDPRQQDLERALAGQLGKTLRGDVLAKMNDGSYLVKVAGTAARMMLPPSTPVGSPVSLHLVALQPRPTFHTDAGIAGAPPAVVYTEAGPALLPGPEGSAARAAPLAYGAAGPAPVRDQAQVTVTLSAAAGLAAAGGDVSAAPARQLAPGALLLSRAPLTPASALPAIDLASTPDLLSAGARTIAGVLAAAARAPRQTAVVSGAPLLASGPVQAQHVAQALREALGKSGLFYESHLKEWSEGTRPLSDLAREPQMQRSSTEAGAARRDPAADPATAGFINLQLATQEQGRIAWHGYVLPGQPLEWEIERDAPDGERRAREDEAPAWRSGMRLRFPNLGEVNASLVLSGGQVHLRLDAASPAAAARLRASMAELGNSLEAVGAPLASFAVRDSDA